MKKYVKKCQGACAKEKSFCTFYKFIENLMQNLISVIFYPYFFYCNKRLARKKAFPKLQLLTAEMTQRPYIRKINPATWFAASFIAIHMMKSIFSRRLPTVVVSRRSPPTLEFTTLKHSNRSVKLKVLVTLRFWVPFTFTYVLQLVLGVGNGSIILATMDMEW